HIHRRFRSASHGINITKSIGCGDLTKAVGIIDHRWKEINSLNKGQVIRDSVDPGIISPIETDKKVRIHGQIKTAERLIQVAGGKFGGTPRPLDSLGKS